VFRRSKGLGSEIYARSSEGMWIKAQVVDGGIELLWQARVGSVAGKVLVYDANGNVDYEMDRYHAVYPSVMASAGVIPVDDEFVDFFGEDRFEDGVGAVMRHSANMLAKGYGDSPGDIVGLMSDVKRANFMNGVEYLLDGCVGVFTELDGASGVVSREGDSVVFFSEMAGEEYEMDISEDLQDFIISSVPI
jgi:hypothetical protein